MRRFVVIGGNATASADFLLDDVPGTSGRLDVGLRCLRAGLLLSHGVRRNTVVYVVLGGGPRAPRTLRVSGAHARFVRPDERSLAILVQKALAAGAHNCGGFVDVRPGVSVSTGGVDTAIGDLDGATPFVLEEGGPDVREASDLDGVDVAFFVGDHTGFDLRTRSRLAEIGAIPLGIGPLSVHAEDAIAIVSNEIDRREAKAINRCSPPG